MRAWTIRRTVAHGRPADASAVLDWQENGAGEEIRTLDPNLGKVVLYH